MEKKIHRFLRLDIGGEERSLSPLMSMALSLAALVVFLEVSFHVSKNSFFMGLGMLEKSAVVLNSVSLMLVPAVLLAAALKLIPARYGLYNRLLPPIRSAFLFLFLAGCVSAAFVHIDTWMYSTYGLNVTDLPAYLNRVLLVLLIAFSLYLYGRNAEGLYSFFRKYRAAVTLLYVGLFAVLLFSFSLKTYAKYHMLKWEAPLRTSEEALPNIIVFSPDGLDSAHMSAYGYERKTTPNIDGLAERSFLYNRAYSNCSHSRCSDISTLESKSPLRTKVLFAPDILSGRDTLQHLPGVLASLGYYNVYFGDPYDTLPKRYNMQLAFHEQNGFKTGFDLKGNVLMKYENILDMEFHFLSGVVKRFRDRLGFIAGLSRSMLYSKQLLGDIDSRFFMTDEESTMSLKRLIEGAGGPIFAYFHVSITHGPRFGDRMKVFSAGKTQVRDYETDFYDDAILSMDYIFGLMLESLAKSGKLENTVIIIKTDHGVYYEIENPVPLIVHLPGQTGQRVVDLNVQYMDIAPSLVSLLGLPVPGWMEGSVIFPGIDERAVADRPIYIVRSELKRTGREIRGYNPSPGPPYYGVDSASVIKQDMAYVVDIKTGAGQLLDRSSGQWRKYFGNPGLMLKYRGMVIEKLKEEGFSGLPYLDED
jgi:hypothetical protein